MTVRIQIADDGTAEVVIGGDTLDTFEATFEADDPPGQRAALVWGEAAISAFEHAIEFNEEAAV